MDNTGPVTVFQSYQSHRGSGSSFEFLSNIFEKTNMTVDPCHLDGDRLRSLVQHQQFP